MAEAESPFTLLLDYDEKAAPSALETLRHLTSMGSFERGLLRVVIAGSPDLAESLGGAEFAHEVRRVPLSRLTPAEVESYIDYRLRLVGWRGSQLLTSKACSLIAERSGASPAAINEICSRLLQNLGELNRSHSDGASRTQNSILDESYVDLVISGRKPTVPTPVRALDRRSAALVGIVFVLVLVMAGLWYRSGVRARTAKPNSAEMKISLGFSSRGAVLHDPRPQRSPDGADAISAARDAGEGIAGTNTPQTASEFGRADQTARASHVASPAAAEVISAIPGRTVVYDPAPPRPTNAWPATLLSSPITGAPIVSGDHPAAAVSKAQRVSSAPFARFVETEQTSASSAVPQRITATHQAAARGAITKAGDSPANTVDELAAYQIRLGDGYMKVGDYDQALASFSRAIALVPNDKEAEEKVQRARRAKTAEESVLQ